MSIYKLLKLWPDGVVETVGEHDNVFTALQQLYYEISAHPIVLNVYDNEGDVNPTCIYDSRLTGMRRLEHCIYDMLKVELSLSKVFR